MRRVVTVAPERMELVEEPDVVAGPSEALVRVETVGLCGSDYHLYDGTHPYARFPQTQGHEFVGRIETLPATYDGPLRAGDRVAVEPLIPCGACFACRRGRYNCCVDLRVMGAHVPGGLAELVSVMPAQLYPVGDLAPSIAVLIEPVSIGMQCVVRADVRTGDNVVVVGAGPIGLAVALAAQDRGANVLVVDRVASRLTLALRMGATRTVDTSVEKLDLAVDRFTGGEGAAVVVEATGVPALVRQAIDLTAHSGTVVIVGISVDEVGIPVSEFSRKELSVLGSRNNAGLFPAAADLVARHAERVSALVTHTFSLTEVPAAIEFARHHPEHVEKVVVEVAR